MDTEETEYTPTNREKAQHGSGEETLHSIKVNNRRPWSTRNWNHIIRILAKYVGHPYDDAVKALYKKFPDKKHRHDLDEAIDTIVKTATEAHSDRWSYCVDLFWKDEKGILRRRRITKEKSDYVMIPTPKEAWIKEWYVCNNLRHKNLFGATAETFLEIIKQIRPVFYDNMRKWLLTEDPIPESDVNYIISTYGDVVGQYVMDHDIDPILISICRRNPKEIVRRMIFDYKIKNRYKYVKRGTPEYYQYIKSKKRK